MTNQNDNLNFSEKDMELALHALAKEVAANRPETKEQVTAYLNSLDVSAMPSPNITKLKKALAARKQGQSPQKKLSLIEVLRNKLAQNEAPPLTDLAGVAARKGKKKKPPQNKDKGGSQSSRGNGQ
jgi:hypothetical protein